MLSHAGLSGEFWAKALMTAVHVINRSPNANLDSNVAKEAWSGKKPSYNHLRIFGCEAFAHVLKELRKKLDPKSRKCIFMGYGETGEMGYRLWDPESKKIIRSHDVVFFNEKQMHKTTAQDSDMRKVTFQDAIPPAQENQRKIVPALPANLVRQPGTPSGGGLSHRCQFFQQCLSGIGSG